MITIGFIGAGNMGFAIMKGAAESALAESMRIYAFDPDEEKLARLNTYGISSCASGIEVIEKSKYVFLAVKPQMFDVVLDQIAPAISEDTVLVSIAAGITAKYIRSKTLPNAKVILVMPNTPLLLGEGATALAKCAPTNDEEFSAVRNIFDICGKTAEVPENKMKEIIAVNGSSPAFIYLFAKAFVDYAAKEGISSETALPLFAQSLIGSAKMLTDSGYTIEELIRMVSSPGGTTLAGLDQLYNGKLEETVDAACTACTKRAYELSK
ncbi:MAG: pyrroline-5-carboxylate reductase [Oscillospiraceae bacterium]|nr:pyrroline-5-carboxylate reductase [Oscillospiraceae bacterium]MBR4102120.1 pyrroline-5-carboxylate reductase [Oscillospiraceae bacterium]